MKVKDIMTANPVCCSADTPLVEAARLMVGYDCGELPVVENAGGKKLVGVITDRDIVCRTIGQGLNPMSMRVKECFSQPAISIKKDASFEECVRLMQTNQIRRVPVVGDDNSVCGIISLADITKYSSPHNAGEVLREVSIESDTASKVVKRQYQNS